MFSKQIAETIHFFIRKNKLQNIIALLLEKKTGKNKIVRLSEKIENLLLSPHDIYDWKQAKYIHFLENISKRDDNEMVYEIYSIPTKNNNLCLVFLMYFYLKNKSKGKEKPIFDIIYTYFLVIVYRNKFSFPLRNHLLSLKNKTYEEFLTFGNHFTHGKIKFLYESIAIVCVVSFFFLDVRFIQTNVLFEEASNVSNIIYSTLFFDSIETMFSNLKLPSDGFDTKNLIMLFFSLAFIGYIKEFIKSTFLQNIFGFFMKGIKILFDVLMYFISVSTNLVIWNLFKIFANLKYNVLGFAMVLFFIVYTLIYFVSVFFYIILFFYLLGVSMSSVFLLAFVSTLVLIYSNFYNGLTNFETFLIHMNEHIKIKAE